MPVVQAISDVFSSHTYVFTDYCYRDKKTQN